MQASDLKSALAFNKAMKTWRVKHKPGANPLLSNDFKVIKQGSITAVTLAPGNEPGAFLVCTINKKYLRTIFYIMKGGKLLPTTEKYRERRKGFNSIVDDIATTDWVEGTFHGSPCLFTSNPYFFVEAYSKIYDQPLKSFLPLLQEAYTRANDQYYNDESGESFLTDEEFDALEAILEKNKAIPTSKKVGAPVKTERKVKLPNVMPSLEFEKTPAAIKAWATKKKLKGLYYSPKVDGISLQLIYKKGRLAEAYVRGDGEEAELKTHIAKNIPNIPQTLKRLIDLECRVEAYMDDETFKKKYGKDSGTKYKFSSPRACVAGMFNRKVPELTILKDVKVACFEAFKGIDATNKSDMINKLAGLGMPVVPLMFIQTDKLDQLTGTLSAMRQRSPFAMDGIVLEVGDFKERDRIGTETNSINPAWAKAFKPNADEVGRTTVKSIRWKLSDTGYITPTAMLEGVDIKGANVTKANCFNAAYIRDNNLGPGSIVEVQRSGDAIPHIVRVVKGTKPDYSGAEQFGKYSWSETKVHFILDKGNTGDELQVLQLIRFFESVGAEYFSEATIRKLYKGGFTTVPAILRITDKELTQLGGFQAKAIERTRTVFKKLTNPGITLPTFMYASGAFGRGLGKDKLLKIYEEYGDDCIYGWNDQTLRDIASAIETIRGFSFDTGVQFAKGIKPFLKFAQSTKGLISIIEPKQATGSKLKGTVAYLTGFRNAAISDFIIEQGGKVASGFSNSTNLLLIKSKATNNDKTAKAAKLGTTVMTEAEFLTKYMKGV